MYSSPEAASVGLTEEQANKEGYELKIGKFPFRAIGKALVFGESDGFVKIIADKKTNDILGVHMIGPHVTDMISEAGLAKVLMQHLGKLLIPFIRIQVFPKQSAKRHLLSMDEPFILKE